MSSPSCHSSRWSPPSRWPGLGLSWIDIAIAAVFSASAAGCHGRLPPLLHPRLVQGQAALRVGLAIAGSNVVAGLRDQVGRRTGGTRLLRP